MRLRRVEAIRYGGLSDALLEEFGDGLTVVLGPNEAGKSTFTALVRHLLYGFPKRNAKEASYAPRAGDRHGRLVFEGDHGVWALERVDGVHGGPVSVRTLRGADYPGQLRDDLVSGVSESAYRVVFGFGLSDLAAIEQMRDSGDDIVGRLYSAGTGVAVNPVEVRARLLDSAGAIWAPGATRRRLNTLLAERDELRVRLQALAAEAETFAADRARLETLDAEVETARVQRDRFEVTSRDTSRAVEQVEARAIELAGAEAALLEARAEVEREGAALAGVVPDGRVLGAAPEIEAVLADLSGHRDRMERLAAAEAELAQIDGRVAAERAALGGPAGAAPGIQLGQSEEVEEWRTRLERVALRADESRRAARDGEAASRVAARTDESSGARPGPTAAYAMFAFGAVAVAVGAFIGQWPMWLMGLLLLATGALFLFSRVRVTVSGTTPGTTPGTEELTASARLAAQRASDDAGDVESARGEWAAWLVSAGLRPGITPAEAAAVVSAGKAIAALENDRAVRAEALASERATAEAYAARLSALVAVFVPEAPASTAETAAVTAERLREALTSARAVASQRDSAAERLRVATARVTDLDSRAAGAEAAIAAVLTEHAADSATALRVAADAVHEQAVAARDAFEALAEERSELKGRLDTESRDSGMGAVRAEQSGVEERIISAQSDYAVLACAARLLGATQEKYERDRQPQVVTAAGDVFRRITGDRFARINVPLGGRSIQVVTGRGTDYTTESLSRGTAEALYLAMRIGLIEQLGAVGGSLPVLMDDILVNLDPERRQGAAEAIAHLASVRQVVVFTCHRETLAALQAADPGCTLIEIGRCPAL